MTYSGCMRSGVCSPTQVPWTTENASFLMHSFVYFELMNSQEYEKGRKQVKNIDILLVVFPWFNHVAEILHL